MNPLRKNVLLLKFCALSYVNSWFNIVPDVFPLPLNSISYVIGIHCATNAAPSSGIVAGTASLQPLNIYPVFVGFSGAVTSVS